MTTPNLENINYGKGGTEMDISSDVLIGIKGVRSDGQV